MSERLQPGDIWQHTSMATLYVTSEDMDLRPGYLKLLAHERFGWLGHVHGSHQG